MFRETLQRSFGAFVALVSVVIVVTLAWAGFQNGNWSYAWAGLAAVGGFFYGIGQLFPGEAPPMPVTPGDPLMQKAIDDARRSMNRFRSALGEGRKDALVKYPLRTKGGGIEHVWAAAHSMDGTTVVTSLLSQPLGEIEALDARQPVPVAEIEDWMLVDTEGRIEGAYTQIAMARIYKRDKGFVPYAVRMSLRDFADLPSLDAL
jgi:uncharacterized protein YegJ (DUF2314 family)